MDGVRTKLGENGEIVIPPPYLQVLGIEVGDTLILRLGDGEVRIIYTTTDYKKDAGVNK